MANILCYDTETLDSIASKIKKLSSELQQSKNAVSGIASAMNRRSGADLYLGSSSYFSMASMRAGNDEIQSCLQQYAKVLERYSSIATKLSGNVNKVSKLMDETETNMIKVVLNSGKNSPFMKSNGIKGDTAGFVQQLREWFSTISRKKQEIFEWVEKKYQERVSDPFDDWGQYGGDQGSPAESFKDHDRYKDIIENNTGHSFKNDKELKVYLDRMNNEGCGYIAICNTIFSAFRDNPEGFQEAFGFSMYDGMDLNYNELFVDLYSTWDNKTTEGVFTPLNDYDSQSDPATSKYSYWSDSTGSGTFMDWRANIAVQYLNAHSINATSESHDNTILTADEYNTMLNNGSIQQGEVQIRMSGRPAFLRDSSGKIVSSYSGGHAMTVTGTTGSGSDAMLIVSSWGKTYYVSPRDFCATDSDGLPTGTFGYMILDIGE